MEAETILSVLYERNKGVGILLLQLLGENGGTMQRTELKNTVNNVLVEKLHKKPALHSRHGMDKLTHQLQGAGLIDIEEIGTAYMYSISKLGKVLLNYAREQQAKKKKSQTKTVEQTT